MKKATFNGPAVETLTPPVDVTEEQQAIIAMAASLLLDYPEVCAEDEWNTRLTAIEDALASLPETIADDLRAFLDAARTRGARRLAQHYVDIFDHKRRCSLYLSYYAVGDTRQRGTAILAFGDALRASGCELARRELPDHLCVVLEAIASVEDPSTLVDLLRAHRDGIEVLRASLESFDSPYHHVIAAITQMLPLMDDETTHRFLSLVRQGPPAELVGIADTTLPLAEVTHS